MTTTYIIVNSLSELKTVAKHYGIEINSATASVSFPYNFEIDHEFAYGDDQVLTFDDFKKRNIAKP